MGKAAKARRSNERMKMRRAEKERKKMLYASLAGTSKKKKRQNYKSVEPGKFNHETTNCGNIGCKKCYPRKLSNSA